MASNIGIDLLLPLSVRMIFLFAFAFDKALSTMSFKDFSIFSSNAVEITAEFCFFNSLIYLFSTMGEVNWCIIPLSSMESKIFFLPPKLEVIENIDFSLMESVGGLVT